MYTVPEIAPALERLDKACVLKRMKQNTHSITVKWDMGSLRTVWVRGRE